MSDLQAVVQQITDKQADIRQLREVRSELEANIADIDRLIDETLVALSELQEKMNAAIASGTHKAVGG